MVAAAVQIFSSSTGETEVGRSEFETSLLYSFRTARATQKNHVFKKKKNGAREMAKQLRAPTVLPGVLSSFPSNYVVAHNHL